MTKKILHRMITQEMFNQNYVCEWGPNNWRDVELASECMVPICSNFAELIVEMCLLWKWPKWVLC